MESAKLLYVNALSRAIPISTLKLRSMMLPVLSIVSMPSVGRFPFLLFSQVESQENSRICVNALSRAIPISTEKKFGYCEARHAGVNALNRAILISTSARMKARFLHLKCVNALNRAILISTEQRA